MYKNSIKNKIHNHIMLKGHKHTAEKVLFKSFKLIQKKALKKQSEDILKIALVNVSPALHIKKIQRKRKKTIEFPFLLKTKLKLSYGIKNLINFENKLSMNSFYKNFNLILFDSSNKTGSSFNYKKHLHKEAFIKKKFANFRWF